MDKRQRDHITHNIVRLIDCTKNESDWYNQLLEKKFLTQSTWQRINKETADTNSKIREIYLETMKTPQYNFLIETLEKSNNNDAAKILKQTFVPSSSAKTQKLEIIWFDIKSGTQNYKGRERELEVIHDMWLTSCSDSLLTIVSITGLGGIGKSELAINYALKFNSVENGHCIWLNAEDNATIYHSFNRLVKKIGIPLQDDNGKEKPLHSLLDAVFQYLSTEKYLVVFDNLENDEEFFSDFVDQAKLISPMKSKPFILLTSRNQLLGENFGDFSKQVDLKVLSEKSAILFFTDALAIPRENVDTITDLKTLCQLLDNLPLAMQQAAAYIKKRKRYSDTATEIKNYLKAFEKETKKFLTHPVPKHQGRDSLPKSTYLTWQITMEKVGPLAVKVLNIISYFQSDNISATFLKNIIKHFAYESDSTDENNLSDTLEALCDYSMFYLHQIDNEPNISIHRLVQTVSQMKLKEDGKWMETINKLLNIVHDTFQSTVTYKDLTHIFKLILFTEQNTNIIEEPNNFYNILRNVSKVYQEQHQYRQGKAFHKFAVKQTKQLFGVDTKQTINITLNYGITLLRSGEINKAEIALQQVYKQRKKYLNETAIWSDMNAPNYPILDILSAIAELRFAQGKYDDALNKYLEVLENEERVIGTDHLETLTTKNNIAMAYMQKGNYDEAIKILFEVLEIRNRVLGSDHPDTLSTRNNIANAYKSKGSDDEALKMLLEVLEIKERVLGSDHPDTLNTRHSIAIAYDGKGNYDNALKTLLEVLEIKERVLGCEHPDTLTARNDIAVVHDKKGNYNEALKILLEVLEIKGRVLGFDHPNTLRTRNNIASTYSRKGNYDEALKMLLKIMKIQDQVLGSDHLDTLTTRNNMALAYMSKRNYDDAVKIFLEVLKIQERVLGSDHHVTLTTRNNIAMAYMNKPNYDESLKILLDVLYIQERVLGYEHPNTLITMNNIAMTYKRKGNNDKSLKMLLKVLSIQEQVLGSDHPSTLTTKNNIATSYEGLGNFEEALQILLMVLKVKERTLGCDHPDTLTISNNIAMIFMKKGNYDEGFKMLLQVLKIKERALGCEHPDTLTIRNNIAMAYMSKGDYDDALKILLEILEIKDRVLGCDHPDTLTAMNNIVFTYDSKGNYDEAIQILLQILKIKQRLFGSDHLETIAIRINIATTYKSKEDYDEELKMLLEVLEIQDRVLGSDHTDTLTTRNNIAMSYMSKQNYDEAHKMLLKLLKIQERVLGSDHPSALITRNNIAKANMFKGNFNEAFNLLFELLAKSESLD